MTALDELLSNPFAEGLSSEELLKLNDQAVKELAQLRDQKETYRVALHLISVTQGRSGTTATIMHNFALKGLGRKV